MDDFTRKIRILKQLTLTIKETERASVDSLELLDPEQVRIHFSNGYKKDVCIACDSDCAMIRDVMDAIR